MKLKIQKLTFANKTFSMVFDVGQWLSDTLTSDEVKLFSMETMTEDHT